LIKKIRNILVFILFLQVFIFVIQNTESNKSKLSGVSEFYFESMNIDDVLKFEIKDKAGHLKFDKIENNWFLNENDGRVSSEKVKKLFDSLKDITKFGYGVVSEASHSSFKVNDDNYSKMITLTGTETITLFFGSTTETGRSYLRVEGEQKVHGINFALDSLSTEPGLWLEPKSQKNPRDTESK